MQTVTISPEERTLAAITHLSGLSGYIIPLGGIVVPIVIWLVKSESRVISSIAKQAILLNLIVFFLLMCGVVLSLTIILIPIAIVMWMVLGLTAIVLPIVGALKANQGIYYCYPVVGIAPTDPTTVPSQV
ncbi:MAG TPA: DUF4870 domain-containing protein [Vicinamibacterales bacterium]|nr:DUF4870 domain-containing protein [Vicinamibacterales bacterium]